MHILCVANDFEHLFIYIYYKWQNDKNYRFQTRVGQIVIVYHNTLNLNNYIFLQYLSQRMLEIEQIILLSDTVIPIYVLNWSPEVKNLIEDLADSKIIDENASSAAKGIYFEI